MFAICFADGTFGPQMTEEFRRAAVRAAHEDFVFRLDVLYIAATGGRRFALPELSDADIEQLAWVPKSVDQILKEARKRPGRSHGFRAGRRDRDEVPEHGTDGHPRTEQDRTR